jgi:NAD(P)-dependent dehydrogenase (short-subunit alcohol dehydrogenase family)
MRAVITGGDSGIGRAVAIAYAREGADILIAYLSENDDAAEVKSLIEKEGRKAVLVAGDLRNANHCRAVIKKAVDELGGIDILVNNAAHQATFKDIGDISDEEWELTFKVNIHAMFYLTKAAVPHMKPGSAIVNTASINSDMPNPILPHDPATGSGKRRLFNSPGLTWPFLAAVAALIIFWTLYLGQSRMVRQNEVLTYGIVLGLLSGVVLFAIMRAFDRSRTR